MFLFMKYKNTSENYPERSVGTSVPITVNMLKTKNFRIRGES